MKAKIFTVFLILASCQAHPDASDVERVKEDFLSLRFRSSYQSDLQQMSDMQLFEMSCKRSRVRCQEVLSLLEKQDKTFVDQLKKDR